LWFLTDQPENRSTQLNRRNPEQLNVVLSSEALKYTLKFLALSKVFKTFFNHLNMLIKRLAC